MQILIVGNTDSLLEAKEKFGETHSYLHAANYHELEKNVSHADVVFDFMIAHHPEAIRFYDGVTIPVFFNTVLRSLSELFSTHIRTIHWLRLGFNGLPTLLNRSLLEVSVYREDDNDKLQQLCTALNTEYEVVNDRVGMVTPRVICMIINEAYYTAQEGTASREDIDIAMKLGTNYPFGPFEWCARIGITTVYDVLNAVYLDTRDERYKICPLLKTEYLRAVSTTVL